MKISVELQRDERTITLESESSEDTLIAKLSCGEDIFHEVIRPFKEDESLEEQLKSLHNELKAKLMDGLLDEVISQKFGEPSPSTKPPALRVEASGARDERSASPPQPSPGEAAKLCPRCNRRYEFTRQRCPNDGKALVDDLSGQTIDRYVVKNLIGVGGMDSTVWKAWQTSTERPIALKLLPNPDQSAAERFSRGAKIASNLNHPNITTIHDYGISENHLYLAMELLEGQSLHGLLKQLPWLRAERALHITDQILKALQHAHDRQVVHRDLKPGNLFLINRNDDPDFVKIVDFGIAKFVTGADEEFAERLGQDVTEQRQICGTPRYMAPEQITLGVVDQRTDLYSVGVVLYRMLTGRTPFEDSEAHHLFRAHLRDTPPRFSEVRPSVTIPAAVEAVVFRALSKDPADRFRSASEMRSALKNIRRQEGWIDEQTSASMTMMPSSVLLTPPHLRGDKTSLGVRLGVLSAFFVLLGLVVFLSLDKLESFSKDEEIAEQTTLELESEPTKALVYKGDKLLGETPLSINLPQEVHQLTLKHAEAKELLIELDLREAGAKLQRSVSLSPKSVALVVDAGPPLALKDAAPEPVDQGVAAAAPPTPDRTHKKPKYTGKARLKGKKKVEPASKPPKGSKTPPERADDPEPKRKRIKLLDDPDNEGAAVGRKKPKGSPSKTGEKPKIKLLDDL